MAALASGIFWLHSCTVGGSRDTSSISIYLNCMNHQQQLFCMFIWSVQLPDLKVHGSQVDLLRCLPFLLTWDKTWWNFPGPALPVAVRWQLINSCSCNWFDLFAHKTVQKTGFMQVQTLKALFGYGEKNHVCLCQNMYVQIRIDFMLLEENNMCSWLLIHTWDTLSSQLLHFVQIF